MATKSEVPDGFNEGFFESSTSTIFKKAKYQHKWSIHDFSDYCDLKGHKIESSVFSDGTKDGLKWRLEINRDGWYYNCGNKYLSLDIILVSNNRDKLDTICHLSILNGRQEQLNKVKKSVIFSKSNDRENYNMYINKNVFFDPDSEYLSDNKLTILCEIVMLGNSENTSAEYAMPNDLGSLLFESSDYTVVTFSVLGRELPVLKEVLVASSPVFAAMFEHDTIENETNRIEIKDIDYAVLQEMLRFIYTNKISNLESVADRLLTVADKYLLENLKRKCVECMIKNVSVANATKYYILAIHHNIDELRMRAKNFIMANVQAVIRYSNDYKLLFEKRSEMVKGLSLLK